MITCPVSPKRPKTAEPDVQTGVLVCNFQNIPSHVVAATGADGVAGSRLTALSAELQFQPLNRIMAATFAGTGFGLPSFWKTHGSKPLLKHHLDKVLSSSPDREWIAFPCFWREVHRTMAHNGCVAKSKILRGTGPVCQADWRIFHTRQDLHRHFCLRDSRHKVLFPVQIFCLTHVSKTTFPVPLSQIPGYARTFSLFGVFRGSIHERETTKQKAATARRERTLIMLLSFWAAAGTALAQAAEEGDVTASKDSPTSRPPFRAE